MSTYYQRLVDLPFVIDSYQLSGLEQATSSGFNRKTTIIELSGNGHCGCGEDVTYESLDQERFQEQGPVLELAGSHTIGSFSTLIGSLDLFPLPPEHAAYRLYRQWAFESAALDLALRQAGISLGTQLGLSFRPVNFVVSLRLGEPPSLDPLRKRLDVHADLRFKLDPTSSWDQPLIDSLAATGAVDSLDLKGTYKGSVVDQLDDPVLYRRVVDGFPDAWIEDPRITVKTGEILADHHDRITWDEPIHSLADIEALPFPPRALNFKPSRFGSLKSFFDAYDFCEREGILMYGGGQFELGVGRGHIQYLASLLYPDGPNDVAPGGYNATEPTDNLPASPLPVSAADIGFCWES